MSKWKFIFFIAFFILVVFSIKFASLYYLGVSTSPGENTGIFPKFRLPPKPPDDLGDRCNDNSDCSPGGNPPTYCLGDNYGGEDTCKMICGTNSDCFGNQACTGGICTCPGGDRWCGGAGGRCTDTGSSNLNCGGCVEDGEGSECYWGQQCSGGSCQCEPIFGVREDCNGDGYCENLQEDPNNCFMCGNACPQEGAECSDGQCGCPSFNPVECNGECIETDWNNENCGACGNECSEDRRCREGSCECRVQDPDECDGQCTDLNWDEENCGTCGNFCNPHSGASCIEGKCECQAERVNCCDEDGDEELCGPQPLPCSEYGLEDC